MHALLRPISCTPSDRESSVNASCQLWPLFCGQTLSLVTLAPDADCFEKSLRCTRLAIRVSACTSARVELCLILHVCPIFVEVPAPAARMSTFLSVMDCGVGVDLFPFAFFRLVSQPPLSCDRSFVDVPSVTVPWSIPQ